MSLQCQCLIVLLVSFLGTAFAADYCLGSDGLEYCPNGCCGTYDSPCCNVNVAAIVGGVIGGILLISCIIVLICCCIRQRGAQGTVIVGQQQHMAVNTIQYQPPMYPQANAVAYPYQPVVAGAYPQSPQPLQPPPYQPQAYTSPQPTQQNPQGYQNAGFIQDLQGNQTTEKPLATAPPGY